MGRTADAPLKARAKSVGLGAAAAIKLVVHLHTQQPGHQVVDAAVGTMTASFTYNAEVVAAIKQLAPPQRAFQPDTKTWQVHP